MRWMTAASQEPPPTTTLGAPRERGCPLQPQKNGRSCRTSSTLQHHSPGGGPGDCDLQLHRLSQVDSWLGQLGTRHDDDEAFRRGERMGRVGFDSRIFFPWMAGQVTRVSPYVVPFPPRRSGEYRKGMIPARPLYQGGCGSVWGPEPSKERIGDWGGPATVWSLLCGAETRATMPNGEWGYSTRRQCWATSAQRRCHPEEALYLPTFSHLFDRQ